MAIVKRHPMRYLLIVVAFCLICVIYLSRLFYIQISGRENSYSTDTTTRTVTVTAMRGEIYDRNGKKLVANSYSYDLILAHHVFLRLPAETANQSCLTVFEALESCGESAKHVEKYFPFEGAYPYYSFSDEASDGTSIPYYRLQRVLGDLGLEKGADAQDLADHYVETYRLLATDAWGNRLFDDDEVDRLIRFYYDLDAMRFASSGEYTIAENIGLPLMTYLKEKNPSGISFSVSAERVYLYPGYASHILGLVGPIYYEEWGYYNEQGYQMNSVVGKSGCEKAFESYLVGIDGELRIEEDSAGNVVSVTTLKEPVAGSDIYLTIDIDLQMAAEDGLKENVEYVVGRSAGLTAYGADCNAGAAVAIDPNTFEVLAIASYPSFDLSTYHIDFDELNKNDANPLLNRALGGSYAPGSTYKLGVAVAAMMEGQIDAASTIRCDGTYTRYSDYRPKCSTYGSSHSGPIGVVRAIAVSCNCFFYELGYRMGIDTMNGYMSQFGIGQPTGIELSESTGILAGPAYRQEAHGDPWTPGLTLQAAIGQSDNQATPLQLACYLSTLVNGGTRYSAHLLGSVYSFGKDTPTYTYTQSEDTILDRVEIPDTVLHTLKNGMRDVVTSSATVQRFINSQTVPVAVGGKTGTAQNSSGCDNALFVCAAPYDTPEIVISVVIEQGYTGGYASLTAGRILEAFYASRG